MLKVHETKINPTQQLTVIHHTSNNERKENQIRKNYRHLLNNIPEFVLSEHPKFTEFISSYFLFMGPAELNLESITDVDNILLETQTDLSNFVLLDRTDAFNFRRMIK